MVLRSLLLFSGIVCTIIGLTTVISFFNLFSVGYNLEQYIHLISKDIFCWCLPIGALLLLIYLFLGGKK